MLVHVLVAVDGSVQLYLSSCSPSVPMLEACLGFSLCYYDTLGYSGRSTSSIAILTSSLLLTKLVIDKLPSSISHRWRRCTRDRQTSAQVQFVVGTVG